MRRGLAALAVALAGLLALGALAGAAAADHDSTGPDGYPVNFTWTPYDLQGGPSNNHLPGIDDASHASLSTSENPGGFERLKFVVVRSDDVDFGDCSADRTRAFGIDRGDDDPGTTIDEDLLDNYERSIFEEDRIVIDFYEDSDFAGDAPYINSSDQLVSAVANCFGNPDEPGWYRVRGKLNGTQWSGEQSKLHPWSHYFYICECASEAEARDKLGPPPSERSDGGATPTPTPAPTATPTPAGDAATATPTPATGDGGTADSGDGGDAGPTPTATPATEREPGTPTATRAGGSGDTVAPTTPTLAEGDGLGAAAALLSLVAAAALALRN